MRKIVILALGLAVSLSACGESEHQLTRTQLQTLIENGIRQPYEVDGEQFTGMLYSEYEDGQRAYEIELRDGMPAGNGQGWAKNGQQTFEAVSKEGDDGDLVMVKLRRWSEDGSPRFIEDFDDQRRPTLIKIWRQDGSMDRLGRYAQGDPELEQFWCEQDQKKEERRYQAEAAVVTHWDCKTGTKISEKHYLPGRDDYYDLNGNYAIPQPSDSDDLVSGLKPDGLQQTWYASGELKSRSHYVKGKQTGDDESFYPDGQKKKLAHWKDGKSAGELQFWYANGQLKSRGQYDDNGDQTGVWNYWTDNGALSSVADYDRDAYIDEKYLKPFSQAVTGLGYGAPEADQALYYIEKKLVSVDAKLPAKDDGSDIEIRVYDRWPKPAWTYPIVVARRELIEPLVAAGADINTRDSGGRTALLRCASLVSEGKCDAGTIETLLDHGAAANILDAQHRSALHYLMHKRTTFNVLHPSDGFQEAAVKTLIQAGAPLNARNAKGQTALMRALEARREDLAGLLIDAGADVELRDADGQTAVVYLLPQDYRGNRTLRDDSFTRNMLERLAGAGAGINPEITARGQSIKLHDLAVRNGKIDLARLMEKLGASG